MRIKSKLCFILIWMLFASSACQAQWESHAVRQLNGNAGQIKLPAQIQMVTESWKKMAAIPYIVYMPEKNRLLMQVCCGTSYSDMKHPMVLFSDDLGATWSKPENLHTDAEGKPDAGFGTSLTYLGNGKLITACNLLSTTLDYDGSRRWFSYDYGKTWGDTLPIPLLPTKGPWYTWDPMLVDRNPKTNEVLLAETGYGQVGYGWEGYIRFSTDEGRTWTKAIKVPEWRGTNEGALIRARNGNIVFAARTDNPERFKNEIDHYGGLGVSILRDKTYAWSKLKILYEWGRHHTSMVLLPDGDIVMTYVVRKGYPVTDDDYPQFGIEAVVSHDNGETWDLDHRYILAFWKNDQKGKDSPSASSQSTSSVLLPSGEILTAFSGGYRIPGSRDVELVRWRVNKGPVNSDRNITDAPFNSNLRNKFDPNPSKEEGASRK